MAGAAASWQIGLVNFDLAYTLGVLVLAIVLFASDRFRLDLVALLSLLALVLGGILPFDEAVAGFSSPLVLTVVGLFVIGAGLTETGVADWLGARLGRMAGGGEARLVAVSMLATALFSAFMSSTGTVAILMPVVGRMAQQRGIPLSRVLLPMAFGAHLGSLLTLIATPPNLVVSEVLASTGREPLRFFSLTPLGIPILLLGVGYVVFFGRKHLPESGAAPAKRPLGYEEIAREYGIENLTMLRPPPVSLFPFGPLAPAIPAADQRPDYEPGRLVMAPDDELVEVVVPRRSMLEGKTLREVRFRDRYRATVLGIRRGTRQKLVPELLDEPLQVGDLLLLCGNKRHLRNLRDMRQDLVVVAAPEPPPDPRLRRGPAAQALFITLAMLVVMAFGWLPHALAVTTAAVALVLVNAVRPADAYRAVNWESVVLIAAMLPMGAALERTGATAILVSAIETSSAAQLPHLMLGLTMLATSLFGQVISNTATAILVAPTAARMAMAMGLSPEPFLVGVAVAASSAFATPVASPVNTLVVGPGGYRFRDFVRLGLPLNLMAIVVASILVPLLFPF